jgi:hypothetical protein
MARAGVGGISFSAGEPFLYKPHVCDRPGPGVAG